MSTDHYEPVTREEVINLSYFSQTCQRTLSATDVLDMHADLQRSLAHPDPWLREGMLDYAVRDVKDTPQWTASHLHPSTSLKDLDPWFRSLGGDLAGATTYQATAEMIDLAEALAEANPDIGKIQAEDLPADYGFMWLDKPIPRPSIEDTDDMKPLLMHAVSWALVPSMAVRIGNFGAVTRMPAVRLREWGYNNDPNVRPRPLHLMGQATIPITGGVYTNLKEHWHVHMLWILMGMEIASIRTELPGRQGAKRAANLKHKLIRVITLRRPERGAAEKPSATPRHIDWTCTWLVRGHYRHREAQADRHQAIHDNHGHCLTCGDVAYRIRPHLKGPDGLPLRSADILYKLAR